MPNPQTTKKPAVSRQGRRSRQRPAVSAQEGADHVADVAVAFRPRLLPVTIFVAVLMLGVRVGDIWLALGGDMRGPIGSVQAQQPAPAAPPPPKPPAARPAFPDRARPCRR